MSTAKCKLSRCLGMSSLLCSVHAACCAYYNSNHTKAGLQTHCQWSVRPSCVFSTSRNAFHPVKRLRSTIMQLEMVLRLSVRLNDLRRTICCPASLQQGGMSRCDVKVGSLPQSLALAARVISSRGRLNVSRRGWKETVVTRDLIT